MINLPSAYDGLMEILEEKLDSALDLLTISVLRDKISEKFERIKRRHCVRDYDLDSEDEDEKALYAKTFKGRCRKFGKFGHKAVQSRVDQDLDQTEAATSQGKEKKRRMIPEWQCLKKRWLWGAQAKLTR